MTHFLSREVERDGNKEKTWVAAAISGAVTRISPEQKKALSDAPHTAEQTEYEGNLDHRSDGQRL